MSLSSLNSAFNKPAFGLLLLRVAAGLTMVLFGIPKYFGGQGTLESVGSAMSIYGIDFWPVFWGLLAATMEVVGGAFIILGFVFRPTAFLLFFVMLTALLSKGPSVSLDAFGAFAFPWTMMWVFLGLLFTGPGRFSVGGSSE